MKNPKGITVRQLKDFLNDLPDLNLDGEPFEVWIDNGDGTSSLCKEINVINDFDIMLKR